MISSVLSHFRNIRGAVFLSPSSRQQQTTIPAPYEITLTSEQIEEIGNRLDAIRSSVMDNLGTRERSYIEKTIKYQHILELLGRAVLLLPNKKIFPYIGTAMLSVSKIIDNMEIGHNVMHGQYEWLGEKKFRAKEFEWDNVCPSNQWIHSHNYEHHVNTNIRGIDKDLGYKTVRIDWQEPWEPKNLANLLNATILMLFFEWGMMLHDGDTGTFFNGKKPWPEIKRYLVEWSQKIFKQISKDYIFFPALAGKRFFSVMKYNFVANLVRNIWAFSIIFCGHFPNHVQIFDPEDTRDETRGEWYVRQMLGSCNIYGSPLFHFFSGNLSHQIEHHLFPDMPAVNYQKIAPQVRELCREFGLPYNSGSFFSLVANVWWTIAKRSLPNRFSNPSDPYILNMERKKQSFSVAS